MRMACLYLPGFPLQVAARGAADLVGGAVAVVAPRVVACSRQALAAGVRPRMTAAEARALGVRVVEGDRVKEAALMAGRADVLLGVSPMIDVAEPGVAFALVPPGERAARFGEQMVRAAAAVGLAGRVGIADDRFTAWAATQAHPRPLRVRTVPVGGSA